MAATKAEGLPARNVNALNASERVLQSFWDLAALEESTRVAAAERLVQDVAVDQQQHQAPASTTDATAPVPKSKQLEHALRNCSPVMIYALRRLARGVGSGRAASRQGYATALTGLMAAMSDTPSAGVAGLTADDGCVLLDQCLEASGKGGDVRDALIGRTFGLAALVRAGLVRDAASASKVVTALLQLAGKKVFLREAAVAIIIELLTSGPTSEGDVPAPVATNGPESGKGSKKRKAPEVLVTPSGTTWLEEAAVKQLLGTGPGTCEPLRQFLTCSPQEASAEALLLALCLWPRMSSNLVAASPLPKGCSAPPVAWAHSPGSVPRAQVASIASALFSGPYLKQVLPALQATTSACPRLHLLWSYLLPYLLPGFTPQQQHRSKATEGPLAVAESDVPSSQHLATFWSVVVEEGLFNSSHERKFLGFLLFQVMLPRLPASAASVVFSRNFSRTLANHLSKGDTYLHAMAKKVMERVTHYLARAPDAAAKLSISAALARLGGLGFQAQSSAKSTAGLVEGMDEQGVRQYCQQYMQAFLEGQPGTATEGQANGHGPAAQAPEPESDEEAEGEAEGVPVEVQVRNKGTDAVRALENRRATAIGQLAAALRFPAATDATRSEVLLFLATAALFSPSEELMAVVTSSVSAPKSAGKDAKASKASKAEAKAAQLLAAASPLLQAAARAVAGGAPELSAATRALCAQRLLSAAAAAPPPPGTPASKGSKAQGAPAAPGAHSDPARLLGATLAHIRQVQAQPGAQLAAGPLAGNADVAMDVLRELEDALSPMAQGTRARALLHLVQLLQLHVLGDPSNAPDSSLIFDLRKVVGQAVEGVKLQAMEEQAVASGAAGEDEEMLDQDSDEEDKAGSQWTEVLLDVLLALLSRPAAPLPSAPLRGACEAVWRAACEGLTAAGMQDLLRVVTTSLDKTGAGDVMDDDSEEEEMEEDGGGSDDDDSEDEEDEAPKSEATTPNKKPAKEPEPESEEDSEVETDEPMDDAAMFRIDDKIAAYMRAVADKRKGSKEAADALSALQFRALSLLEMFARKAPTSPQLLATLLPLTRALAAASRSGNLGNPNLAARLNVLLTKVVCKSKPVYDEELLPAGEGDLQPGQDTLPSVLLKLRSVATRSADKKVAAAAGAALATLIRAASAAGVPSAAASAAEAAYTATLADRLGSKKCHMAWSALEDVAGRAPRTSLAAAPLAALLKAAGGGARNAYVQMEAVQLLLATLRAAASTPDAAQELGPRLKAHMSAVGAVAESTTAGAGMKPAYHADAIKATVGVLEALRKLLPERKAGELLGTERLKGITKAIATVRALGVAERVTAQLSRLAQALGVTEALATQQSDPVLHDKLLKAREVAAAKQAAAPAQAPKPKKKGVVTQAPKQGKQPKKAHKAGKQAAGGKLSKDSGKQKAGKPQASPKGQAKQGEQKPIKGAADSSTPAKAKSSVKGGAAAAPAKGSSKERPAPATDNGKPAKKQKKQE